eukprot:COSAG05_NODE_260_length_12737_cov_4.788891_8_plen_95_part_00
MGVLAKKPCCLIDLETIYAVERNHAGPAIRLQYSFARVMDFANAAYTICRDALIDELTDRCVRCGLVGWHHQAKEKEGQLKTTVDIAQIKEETS